MSARKWRQRLACDAKPADIHYEFADGKVVKDLGDGKGRQVAVKRLLDTGVGYRVNHVGRAA